MVSALKDLPVQSTYLYPTLLGTTWPHSLLAHLALRPPALCDLCMTSHDLMVACTPPAHLWPPTLGLLC